MTSDSKHKLVRPGSCQLHSNDHELILAVDLANRHMKPKSCYLLLFRRTKPDIKEALGQISTVK